MSQSLCRMVRRVSCVASPSVPLVLVALVLLCVVSCHVSCGIACRVSHLLPHVLCRVPRCCVSHRVLYSMFCLASLVMGDGQRVEEREREQGESERERECNSTFTAWAILGGDELRGPRARALGLHNAPQEVTAF